MANYFSKFICLLSFYRRGTGPVLGLAAAMFCIALPALAETHMHIHRIHKAELLDVIVVGHDELTTEVRVDKRGRITLPLIGRIKASGKTIEELQDIIAQALEERDIYDPLVLVDLLFQRRFSIQGQVIRPGEYFHTTGMTVKMAVAIAGGFTPWANYDLALLSRSSEADLPPLEVKLNTRVRPGDSIEIERRLD